MRHTLTCQQMLRAVNQAGEADWTVAPCANYVREARVKEP